MPADDAQLGHGLAPGSEVRGYRILRALGAGGFGITYLAEHVDIGNRVAVKEFLPAGIASRSPDGVTVRPVSQGAQQDFVWGLERFRQEARTLGALDHPNIVRVLNFVQANGTAYVVMDYVDGESLGARLNRTRTLPVAEVAALVPGLFAGLEAVHRAGLLHRDVKPDNVIVRSNGVPVLIDFGAARQALGAHSRSLTTVLSEGYAPYEQYDPHGNQGPWTDVYALGGTLYRCVTGDRPVPAPRRIDARVKGKPDPLPPAAERARGPYGPGLLAAIDAALAVLETDRPQDVAALRALLGASEPLSSPPAAEGSRSRVRSGDTLIAGAGGPRRESGGRAWRRPRWALAAGLFVLVAGGATAGYVVVSERSALDRREAEEAADRKRAQAEEAHRKQQEEEAQRRIAELERRKAEAEEARRKAEAEAARRKAEEEAARRKAEEEAARRKAEEEAVRRKAEEDEARRKAEQEEARRKAEEDERRRREEEAERRTAEAQKLAHDDFNAGNAALNRGALDEAIRLSSRAIDSGRLSDNDLATAYINRGVAWHRKRMLDRALQDYNEALRHNGRYAFAYVNRGVYYIDTQDFDRALADLNEAIRLDRNIAHAWAMRGNVWFHKRNFDQSIADNTESLRLRPNDAQTHANRGLAWESKGDTARAVADFRAALRVNRNYQSARDGLRRLGLQE